MAATLQTFGGGTTDFILDPGNDAKPLPNTPYTIIDGETMQPATGLVDGSGAAVTQLTSDADGRYAGGAMLEGVTYWLDAVGAKGPFRAGPQVSTTALANVVAMGPQLDTIASSAAASAFSAKSAQSAAEAAASSATAPAATAIATYFGGDAKAILTGKVTKGDLVVNVRDFGAKGDGATDDTAAAQAAIDSLPASGGTVVFPAGGEYRLNSWVWLRSNLTVDFTGATLRKVAGPAHYEVFVAGSKGATGYGSSVRDVVIRGGIIRGSFAATGATGASITMNHAQNVLIENVVFREAVISGHPIDLGGCDQVTVRKCTFEGWNDTLAAASTRTYTEAIQCDFATRQGNGVDDGYPGSYDGAPTRNLLVEDCRFVPYTLNGTTYPAPNPLGSHSRVEGQWLSNITFRGNYVEGGRDTSLYGGDGFSGISRGWIHFFSARGVKILNNTFVNTGSRAVVVIGSQAISTGVLLTDTAVLAPTASAMTPLCATNWIIEGNTFRDFNSPGTSEPLIMVNGHATVGPTYGEGLSVKNNSLDNCCPVPAGAAADAGSAFLQASYMTDVALSDTRAKLLKMLCYIDRSLVVKVHDNTVRTCPWDALRVWNSDDVQIHHNTLQDHGGGMHLVSNTNLEVDHNRLRVMASTGALARTSHIAVSGGSTALLSRNNMSGAGTLAQGINVYSSAARVRADTNVILSTTTPVNFAAGTTDTVQTATVSA